MHCILATNINKSRGKKNDEEEKKCQIFVSAMYSSYQAGVSPEGGLQVGQTQALCAQTNLFWREMKIILRSRRLQ